MDVVYNDSLNATEKYDTETEGSKRLCKVSVWSDHKTNVTWFAENELEFQLVDYDKLLRKNITP